MRTTLSLQNPQSNYLKLSPVAYHKVILGLWRQEPFRLLENTTIIYYLLGEPGIFLPPKHMNSCSESHWPVQQWLTWTGITKTRMGKSHLELRKHKSVVHLRICSITQIGTEEGEAEALFRHTNTFLETLPCFCPIWHPWLLLVSMIILLDFVQYITQVTHTTIHLLFSLCHATCGCLQTKVLKTSWVPVNCPGLLGYQWLFSQLFCNAGLTKPFW